MVVFANTQKMQKQIFSENAQIHAAANTEQESLKGREKASNATT